MGSVFSKAAHLLNLYSALDTVIIKQPDRLIPAKIPSFLKTLLTSPCRISYLEHSVANSSNGFSVLWRQWAQTSAALSFLNEAFPISNSKNPLIVRTVICLRWAPVGLFFVPRGELRNHWAFKPLVLLRDSWSQVCRVLEAVAATGLLYQRQQTRACLKLLSLATRIATNDNWVRPSLKNTINFVSNVAFNLGRLECVAKYASENTYKIDPSIIEALLGIYFDYQDKFEDSKDVEINPNFPFKAKWKEVFSKIDCLKMKDGSSSLKQIHLKGPEKKLCLFLLRLLAAAGINDTIDSEANILHKLLHKVKKEAIPKLFPDTDPTQRQRALWLLNYVNRNWRNIKEFYEKSENKAPWVRYISEQISGSLEEPIYIYNEETPAMSALRCCDESAKNEVPLVNEVRLLVEWGVLKKVNPPFLTLIRCLLAHDYN